MQRATQIVVELLAKGTTPAEVAEITENSISAICQVQSKYADLIASKRSDSQLAVGGHSAVLDSIENQLAIKLQAMIPLEMDTSKIVNIMKTVNSMVRRDAGESGGTGSNVNVAVLQLPDHVRQSVKIVTNTNNDVVSVAGRDLTPASMSAIDKLAGITNGGEREQLTRTQAFDDVFGADSSRLIESSN